MGKARILAVDDEEDILELIRYNLTKEGYVVDLASTGEQALERARSSAPDLILLDLMLPGLDGLDVCREIKQDPSINHIPILMVTAKGEEADIVLGLEMGADDYITKPFSPRVLLARVRTILRRRRNEKTDDQSMLHIHDLVINPARHEVSAGGEPADLTPTEFRILNFLARRPGWVFTRDQIIAAVKGDDYPVTERSVDVQVAGLRKKLGKSGDVVQTVRGVGYRFKE
jgi:two-component system phosphate regulon response regulator PhoB